jgi:hypothetical protein
MERTSCKVWVLAKYGFATARGRQLAYALALGSAMPETDVIWQLFEKAGLNSRWPTKNNCLGSVQTTRKTRSVWRSIRAPLMLKRVSVDSCAVGHDDEGTGRMQPSGFPELQTATCRRRSTTKARNHSFDA